VYLIKQTGSGELEPTKKRCGITANMNAVQSLYQNTCVHNLNHKYS